MLIAALFIISKRQKQAKCPSTMNGVIKMCYIHTVKYDVAMKRNEALIHATSRVNLEHVLRKLVTKIIYYSI